MTDYVWDPGIGGQRIPPLHGIGAYKTYAILQPTDQGVREACEDVGCLAWRKGWESHVDEATELGRAQATYFRWQSGRDFRETRTAAGITVFSFKPGQRCFAEHRTNPQFFKVRDGDWRGNPTGRRFNHANPADWVEDFGEHQLAVAEQYKEG